jgi:hypothetical protein
MGGPCTGLAIPNRDVRIVYTETFRLWMQDRIAGHGGHLDQLTRALLAGDAAAFERQLQAFATNLLSYHDAGTAGPENLYQRFIIGLLAVMEPTHLVRSNRESGAGRPDVMIRPRIPGQPGVIIELKVGPRRREDPREPSRRRARRGPGPAHRERLRRRAARRRSRSRARLCRGLRRQAGPGAQRRPARCSLSQGEGSREWTSGPHSSRIPHDGRRTMNTLSLRLPESIHRKLTEIAEREGISVDQSINSAVAEKLAALMTEKYLEERAQRASEHGFAVLAKIPDVPPLPGDELPEAYGKRTEK